MARIELELEHRYKDKFVGRHRLTSHKSLTVIGSGTQADIRLLGEDVSAIHAYLESSHDGWRLIDAGSEHGTWISKKPITNLGIDGETVAMIGGHELKITPRKLDFKLFGQEDLTQETATGSDLHHQVILRRRGQIVGTSLLGATESYKFAHGEKLHEFQPPKKGDFVENDLGDFQIQQRLVLTGPVQHEPQSLREKLDGPEARIGLLSLVGLLFLGGLIALSIPSANDAELTPPQVEQNRFTKMIYDADLIKKKRQEARKKQKVFARRRAKAAGNPKPNNKPVTTPVRSKGGTPKVVSKLKMAGLQNLLGKISKRATKSGVKIVGRGRTPDSAGTGRALPAAAVGSLQGVATKAGNGGTNFRVGGVGTVGKGGGGSTQGMGGLALGGVGSASVGIVDDETEIQGGLDKDVIARVINSQLGEIRYCYERQLAAKPDMYGKVVIRFAIDSSGGVSTQRVKKTTLKSAMVEGCILRRVASWQFPKPQGGTTVLVTYPFLFKSTN